MMQKIQAGTLKKTGCRTGNALKEIMMANSPTVFFLIFAISGFSGLIYESIWTHYLKLFLGHAAYAQALVLAIFMGGLSLGSWICSRYSGGWRNLFRGYALAEGAIGVLALIFHPLFDGVVRISYASVMPALGSPAAVNAYKWVVSSLLILPQTVLLGMTFPLMSAALLRRFPGSPGRSLAMLYFTNSIGASVGVLAAGFVLIRLVGLPGTMLIAALINIVLAAVVWILARDERPGSFPSPVLHRVEAGDRERAGSSRWLLFASLATGTASFFYEIGWIRMLSLVLGTSTHAFELMLSAFIFGLAFGGLWIRRRIDAAPDPVLLLIILQIAMGILALASLPLYGNAFGIMGAIISKLPKTAAGYVLFNLSSNLIALSIMLPATFCAGTTLPLITYALLREGWGEDSIGAVYAMNTIGAIVGVFLAIHFCMPLLGLKGLITAGGALDMGVGLLLLWRIRRATAQNRVLVWAAAVCLCAVAATLFLVRLDPYQMASGVYRTGRLLQREKAEVIFHKDGKTATVSVVEHSDGDAKFRSIRTNGKPDASINMDSPHRSMPDEATMVLAAALPMAYHPDARTVANIGFGSGLTTHTLLCNPRLTAVDTIEIERQMVEGAKQFGAQVSLAFDDTRSSIYIDDAKTFFSSHNRKYDIIVSEPSNPWVSGVAGLFSEEFYRLIGRHLQNDGIFAQWVQLYEIDLDLVASVFKALAPSFSDFAVYTANYGDLLIIAKKEGSLGELDASIFAHPRLAAALGQVKIAGMQDLEVRLLGSKKMLGPFFATFPLRSNSDYYPVLDQNASRARFLGASAGDLVRLGLEPFPLVEMLSPSGRHDEGTKVTFSPFHPKTRVVTTAMGLRDYFLRGAFAQNNDIGDDVRFSAEQVRRMYLVCGTAADPNRRVWLFNTAKNMVPYLTPAESAAIWKKLESGLCAGRMSPIESAYISLFKGIGERKGERTAAAANFLLAAEQDITPARLRYVVAAGMLANLAQGSRRESLALWRAFETRVGEEKQRNILFDLLKAESF